MKLFQPLIIFLTVILLIITVFALNPDSQQSNALNIAFGSGPTLPQNYQNDKEFQTELFPSGERLYAQQTIRPLTGHVPPGKAILISPTGTIDNRSPTYTWYKVADSTHYRLWVNDSSGKVFAKWYKSVDVCSGGTCSITPSKVLANDDHTWWIRTWNSSGYGPWSDGMDFRFKPGTATLTSPTGSITDCTPDYTWEEVSGATWYYLWVNDSSGKVFSKWYKSVDVCSGGTCSTTPSTVLTNDDHKWWIQTWNTAGYGPWSTEMNFTVSGCVCTTAPSDATLTSPTGSITDNTPTYTWVEEDCATWYYLWVNDSSGKVFSKWYKSVDVCSGGTCSTTPSTVLTNDDHKWWIQTWNSEGYGPWSSGMGFTVQ